MTRDFSRPGRSEVYAANAMVATSHPIATSAGLKCLTEGGNAVDAAIVAASVLSIAEPHMTSLGGDCFALVSGDGLTNISALNGSGKSPQALSLDITREAGMSGEIPRHNAHAVTTPGSVDAWWRLHQRFGHSDWDKLFSPAINYAEHGIAVHERTAWDWGRHAENLADDEDARRYYLNGDKAYGLGEVFCCPPLAEALKLIAKDGRDGFYQGPVAEDILSKLNKMGGVHEHSDFADAESVFVPPISASYLRHKVWECPPNGQGLTALIIMKILERFDLATMTDIDRVHVTAEASKIAYGLRDRYIADPECTDKPTDWLLGQANIDKAAALIDMTRARDFADSDFPTHPDTVYLAVVDKDGMAVSFINSIFDSFGSGIASPRFGILLQSRGRSFSLSPTHPNVVAGGKRPLHTIIPGMLTIDDDLIGAFGVMGGQYQATGQATFLSNLLALGMGPQQALDSPRSFAYDGILSLESGYDRSVADALAKRGHQIDYPADPIGGGQAILRDLKSGILVGGSDARKDGCVMGY